MESLYQSYRDRGFFVVTAASEDARHNAVDIDDLNEWADAWGLTFPVLEDPAAVTDRLYDPSARSRPTYVLLGRGAEILSIGSTYDTAVIEGALR